MSMQNQKNYILSDRGCANSELSWARSLGISGRKATGVEKPVPYRPRPAI